MRVLFGSYQKAAYENKALFTLLAFITAIGCKQPEAAPPVPSAPPAHAASPAAAAGPVGKLEGTVKLTGKAAALPDHPIPATLEKVCGTSAPDLSLLVQGGLLEGAVISIDDLPPAPLDPAAKAPVIDQLRCTYRPAVIAARAGGKLSVKNSDAALHNVRAGSQGETLFNVAMPLENMTLSRPLPEAPGVVDLHCDVHPWMHAWVATFANDAYAVSDAKGHFELDRVPAGHHRVRAWQPHLPPQTLEVDVPANGSASLDVVWDGSAVQPMP